jgi:integral membrane sensor domain MASE1
MMRPFLASCAALFLGSLAAFFLFVPPLMIAAAALLVTGSILMVSLGIQIERLPVLPSDRSGPKH